MDSGCAMKTPVRMGRRTDLSPNTLPVIRHKARISQSGLSPHCRRIGSPSVLGSPARLVSALRLYTWRDVKGHLGALLGRGGFGSVYRANIQGFELAIKKLGYSAVSRRSALRSARSELLACSLRHRNLVTVFHVSDRSEPPFVIMEYVGADTLQQILDSRGLSRALVRLFARDVASALQYLHSIDLVHLDIKPSNVLITPYRIAKLGDFGCLRRVNCDKGEEAVSPTARLDVTGTVAYRAPELLRGCPPSTQADIYSYGILVWQMLTQRQPYRGKDMHMVIFAVVAQNLRPSLSDADGDQGLTELCQRCWTSAADERPSAADVLAVLDDLSGCRSRYDPGSGERCRTSHSSSPLL